MNPKATIIPVLLRSIHFIDKSDFVYVDKPAQTEGEVEMGGSIT